MTKAKKPLSWLFLAVLLFLPGCRMTDVVGGKIPNEILVDGVYQGAATGGPVKVIVEVTIQDHEVAQITILKHRTGRGKPAEGVIPERIIREQSTAVDAVTGATISSCAIMNAVDDAVHKGMKQAMAQ